MAAKIAKNESPMALYPVALLELFAKQIRTTEEQTAKVHDQIASIEQMVSETNERVATIEARVDFIYKELDRLLFQRSFNGA